MIAALIAGTYSSCWAGEVDSEHVHSFNDGGQTLYRVAIDDRSILLTLLPSEPIVVDDPVQSEREIWMGG